MATPTTSAAEQVCREFAARYPTPAVLAAIDHAAAGRLDWTQVEHLFRNALAAGLAEVGAGS